MNTLKHTLLPLAALLCLTACGDEETVVEDTTEDNPMVNMANKIGDKGLKNAQDMMDKSTQQLELVE